jgi:hypothetical protein
MLYTPVNHFTWQVNNFSDTYPGNAAATTLTAGGSAHTKGSDTAILAGIAEDCYVITIAFSLGDTTGTIRRQMTDLLIDPSAGVGVGGSSWSVAINNIYSNSPSLATGSSAYCYYFPLFLKAGTAVGARVQDVVASATVRFSIRLYGKPNRPELCKVGTKVQTIGATTATTTGVAVTPGTAALGSYSASLGTLTNDAWWWQLGIGSNDTSMSVNRYFFDIAHDATAKYICAQGIGYSVGSTAEQAAKTAFGEKEPIREAPAGTDVYVRGAGLNAPDSSMTAVVYAVSG